MACSNWTWKGLVMRLNLKQQMTKATIEEIAHIFKIDSRWAVAVALTESSLGLNQKSPTGARGVFQMTSIAMKDLLWEMENKDDDLIDIVCGIAFLRLLLRRHGTLQDATERYCAPGDRDFYVKRVVDYMKELKEDAVC